MTRNHMSKEAYLDHGQRCIVQTATDMLEGRIGFVLGSRKLRSLLHEFGVQPLDSELMVFTAIDSETDSLPLGEVRQFWDANALQRLAAEIQDAERWARDLASDACKALIRRFGKVASPIPGYDAHG